MLVDGEMVPRPLGSALHAEQPNELIHFDWLSLPESGDGLKHVLVVKDDMSGFVRLFPSTTADAAATAAALMDWFTTTGTVTTWVSDGGSHFKNEVLEKIRKMVGAHHHVTTAYSPWANGSVEVVNRMLLRAMKALLSEWRLPATQWPFVLPLVQGALNHQPSDRLGGVAPATAFGGFPATTPLSGIVHPVTREVYEVDWLAKTRQKHVAELREALAGLHQEVSALSEKKREQARGRHNKKRGVQWANFDVGDFVLVGSVVRHPSKLALYWRGPCRVTRVITDHVMVTEQLVPPHAETIHHVCRLKLYSEAANGVAEDLAAQIAHGDGGFHVEGFVKAREVDGQYQVLVKWLGLDDEEASWESADGLYEDVPVLLRKWVATHEGDDETVGAMRKSLEMTLGHPL
jgi:transposase InsO family protein